ncbi:hypothetical protein [Clostridium sulfidigenes]|uniref:hypothetical protein n=1 Tax=Clostridium sulfidigenes TaxID=318464 RepID=UPI003F8ABA06
MSNYVYLDEKRTKELYAEDCDSTNLGEEYYCPTPHCTAKMTLRSLSGDVNPYFSPLRLHSHSDFCTIGKIKKSKSKYDTNNFSIEDLYGSVIKKPSENTSSGSKQKSPRSPSTSNDEKITTTSKLYYFCKSHDINYPINDKKIIDLLADSRNNFLFIHKKFWGLRLVEALFYQYKDDKNTISFHYPIDQKLKNKFDVSVKFKNTADYEKIKKKIFKNKETYKSAHICILGNWDNNSCDIESTKQIIVLGSE